MCCPHCGHRVFETMIHKSGGCGTINEIQVDFDHEHYYCSKCHKEWIERI